MDTTFITKQSILKENILPQVLTSQSSSKVFPHISYNFVHYKIMFYNLCNSSSNFLHLNVQHLPFKKEFCLNISLENTFIRRNSFLMVHNYVRNKKKIIKF